MITPLMIKVSTSLSMLLCLSAVHAEQIKVLHPQGSAHGFVEVTTTEGHRIGVGDLLQRAHGNTVTSRLVLHFFDGSLDDETTVYSQSGTFRFMTDHHVQHGASFPTPSDVTIDAQKQMISSKLPDGKDRQSHFDMPPDTYNGMASTLLMNLPAGAAETKIAIVIAGEKPRVVHLSMKNSGNVDVSMGGVKRQVTDYTVHVELGGVAGVVAPLIGKEPLDYHVLILPGADPAFIREEGQLYQGGPLWRVQQISATFPDDAGNGAAK
jgi:hypothetical protein